IGRPSALRSLTRCMSVLRTLAIVMVTDRITAISRTMLAGCDRRDESRSVSFATTIAPQRPKTADHRIDGTRIDWASDDQPFGESESRPSTERRRPRRSSAKRAATSATAGHASGHMAVHAIVVSPHESAWTLLRLGSARRRGHGRRLRTGIALLARRVPQAARRVDALES